MNNTQSVKLKNKSTLSTSDEWIAASPYIISILIIQAGRGRFRGFSILESEPLLSTGISLDSRNRRRTRNLRWRSMQTKHPYLYPIAFPPPTSIHLCFIHFSCPPPATCSNIRFIFDPPMHSSHSSLPLPLRSNHLDDIYLTKSRCGTSNGWVTLRCLSSPERSFVRLDQQASVKSTGFSLVNLRR